MLDRAKNLLSEVAFGAMMAAKALFSPVALGASALIVDRAGKVLLARHSYMTGWSLPGGGVARGEPPAAAVLRELREEIGSVRSDAPELVGVFSRRSGWATNVVLLYRMTNADVVFTPNFEVREILFVDPADPPPGTTAGTRRRLAEFANKTPPALTW
jgi:8-oxo-dGTP pyrophosphatase MutT (NUDIX family)